MTSDMNGERKVKATTRSVATMGDLLLKGYCMLAESCPDCMVPLMRNPEGTRDTCVQCGREFDCLAENGSELAVEEEEEHQDETENSVPAIEKHVADAPSDVSSILADRMLHGWTLLADHCPRCQTPLIRKHDRIFCVSCDLPVVIEGKSIGEEKTEDAKEAGAAQSIECLQGNVARNMWMYMDRVSAQLNDSYIQDECLGRLEKCAEILVKIESMRLA